MNKRVEEAALEAYPIQDMYSSLLDGSNKLKRDVFIKGYEQGQKETIEKALKWFNDTTYFGSGAGEEVKRFLMEDLRKAMEEE